MKKSIMISVACLALAACSNESYVDENFGTGNGKEAPIGFTIRQKNITRATNELQENGHYNFGVWAYKENGTTPVNVMDNYLVGYAGVGVGYNHTAAQTTWASGVGTLVDHKSPWVYEGLGYDEYSNTTDGYYKSADYTPYKSNKKNQYLKYWDLAYTNTAFYAYLPYVNSASAPVTFDESTKKMTLPANTMRDGYDIPQNTAYNSQDRSLSEFMFAGTRAINANLNDVQLTFKHAGAQVLIAFYEEVPGYKVEIIDWSADGATLKTGVSGDKILGVQATPATVSGTTYSKASYYTKAAGSVDFSTITTPSFTPVFDGKSTTTQDNLMFRIPQTGTAYSTYALAPGNLTSYTGLGSTNHNIIEEKVSTGTQKYSYSPTVYYPIAQPSISEVGFVFHVSYRLIAEDTKEVVTVHNAKVFVPATGSANVNGTDNSSATIARWQSNMKYTYIFRITKNSNGSTNPNPTGGYDPEDVTPDPITALYPIVFDACTITDYDTNNSEHVISDGTTYK